MWISLFVWAVLHSCLLCDGAAGSWLDCLTFTSARPTFWPVWSESRHLRSVLWTDGPGLCNLCSWSVFPAGSTGVRYLFVACYVTPGYFLLLVLLVNTWLSSQFKKTKTGQYKHCPSLPKGGTCACQKHKHADSGVLRCCTCVLMRRQQRLLMHLADIITPTWTSPNDTFDAFPAKVGGRDNLSGLCPVWPGSHKDMPSVYSCF